MRKTPLPKLSADPDSQLVRWGWIAWIALTVFLAVRFFALRSNAPDLQLLSSVQLAALWLLWPLVRGGGALWRWMHAAPYAAWNGSYYEFDGRQIRVLFDDDALFLVADDVYVVLNVRGRATQAARVRAIAGREGLIRLPDRREVVFTERGLFAWLDRRTDAKAAAFRRWLELQVIAPHRKRHGVSQR